MDQEVESKTSWVLNLLNTIREAQKNERSSNPSAWRAQIETEIRQALDTLPDENRMEYLINALSQQFRGTQSQKLDELSEDQEHKTKPAELQSEDLIKELVERIPQFPETLRISYAKTLHEAGFRFSEKEGVPIERGDSVEGGDIYEELPKTLIKRLSLVRGKTVNFREAIKMLAQCLETMLTLELLVWNMWKTLAPQSKLQKDAGTDNDLRFLVKEYLSGNSEVPLEKVTTALDLSRQLIASLLGSIGPIGRIFGRDNVNKFSPEAIKSLVKMESSGFSFSQEGRFWKKYMELALDLSEAKIESQIHEAIVKYAEGLMFSGKYRSS